MELQTFINNDTNYKETLKTNGTRVKNINKYDLTLIKYPYDKAVNTDSFERYCRGAIIDNKTNKLICIPPPKSKNYINLEEINQELHENTTPIIQELNDGTMINLFYHNEEWLLSTRSEIGCNNKWNNKKSFKTMFKECSSQYTDGIDYNKLNKRHCYSFTMIHTENRNISHINENMLILVEEYDLDTLQMVELQPITCETSYNGYQVQINYPTNNILEYLEMAKNNTNFSWKGLTIKYNGKRMNYINPAFNYVKELKINNINPLYNFIHLKKENKLNEYISYFPEYIELFTNFENKYKMFVSELYSSYTKNHITNELETKDIPFQLKPLVYELHGHYLNTGDKINHQQIIEYIATLDCKRLTFVLKYY